MSKVIQNVHYNLVLEDFVHINVTLQSAVLLTNSVDKKTIILDIF